MLNIFKILPREEFNFAKVLIWKTAYEVCVWDGDIFEQKNS